MTHMFMSIKFAYKRGGGGGGLGGPGSSNVARTPLKAFSYALSVKGFGF